MNAQPKLFAFKLAEKDRKTEKKWQAREGVSALGCTEYRFIGNYRYWGSAADNGVYC